MISRDELMYLPHDFSIANLQVAYYEDQRYETVCMHTEIQNQ